MPLDFSRRQILLPNWSRAPVFLNAGARLWGVYHKPEQIRAASAMELVVTPIPPEHWQDVWRLEITTEDRPGNLALIYDILRASGIEVLFNEGSMHSFAKYHSMSFILSLLKYENRCDGNSSDRRSEALPHVPGLETIVETNFLNQMIFDGSGAPRYGLKRLNLYWLMDRWHPNNKYKLMTSPMGLEIDHNGGFNPEETFFADLKTLAGNSKTIEYTPAVDTGSRCIRVLFFTTKHHSPGHMQVAAPMMSSDIIQRVMGIVHEKGGNIIRIQLRPGYPEKVEGRFGRLAKAGRATAPARLDLTIEPAGGGKSTKTLLSEIEREIRRQPMLKAFDMDVTKPPPARSRSAAKRTRTRP